MATNRLPLNPELTFKHIGVHAIRVLARIAAKKAVQEQLRADGVMVQYVKPSEINERVTTYLSQHPEVWKEALAMAHRIDDAEGQRKEKRKLRRDGALAALLPNQIARNRALKRLNFLVQLLGFSVIGAY